MSNMYSGFNFNKYTSVFRRVIDEEITNHDRYFEVFEEILEHHYCISPSKIHEIENDTGLDISGALMECNEEAVREELSDDVKTRLIEEFTTFITNLDLRD